MRQNTSFKSKQKNKELHPKPTGAKIDSVRSPVIGNNHNRISSYFSHQIKEIESSKVIYQISQEDLVEALKEILADFIPKIVPELIKREEERLLTAKEAMELMSISATTLWRMEKAGLIKSVGAGKNKRYKYQSISDYINGMIN